LTASFRKRFGYFMVHEAIEQAVALDVVVRVDRASEVREAKGSDRSSWRNKELVTVWPKDIAKASPVWHSQ
jgi:branched-chain amino acid transport system substrate-binding protein